jgi:hypothetical protein
MGDQPLLVFLMSSLCLHRFHRRERTRRRHSDFEALLRSAVNGSLPRNCTLRKVLPGGTYEIREVEGRNTALQMPTNVRTAIF